MKQIYLSIINQIKSIGIFNNDYIFIFNNQIERIKDKGYAFNGPTVFVEIQEKNRKALAAGFASSELVIILHLYDVQLDAGDGTLDQNLEVFDLKTSLHQYINLFKPTDFTTSLMVIDDWEQDFNHSDIYHYRIRYACSFIDNSAYLYGGNPLGTMSGASASILIGYQNNTGNTSSYYFIK